MNQQLKTIFIKNHRKIRGQRQIQALYQQHFKGETMMLLSYLKGVSKNDQIIKKTTWKVDFLLLFLIMNLSV